ncbi:hypothetical protein LSH36_812g00055 [Paralvinella palmiformis]|uniref:Protein FAM207A n=1 Tax=Paralvinella palmiformis TaxID=53620 RepID=A0AAD9J036_9ANNE|nr:hypothetical protein LSH36_812g00055 [Paralvinella palmiformis]
MGKIKNKTRLHAKAVKLNSTSNTAKIDVDMKTDCASVTGLDKTSQISRNIFSKLDIDMNALQRHLVTDDDTRSTLTSKSLKGLNLTKKDKQQLRRGLWLKKVETLQEAKKEAAAKRKRQQTAVVGDMQPLEDTLPTLELLLKDVRERSTQSNKPKPTLKEKQRKKQMLEDISTFKQVLQHPVYRHNPLATIKEHLQNKLAQGNT